MKDKKNKRASIFLGVIFAIFFFILGTLLVPFIKGVATDTRTSLDCTNSSITDGGKITCLIADAGFPYFIIVLLTLVGGFIGNEL